MTKPLTLTESFLNTLQGSQEMNMVQKYEIYRDAFLGSRSWCADAIDAKGDRWVKWQSGYRSRKAVEAACVDFEVAPIERVADEGRYKPRRIERVADQPAQFLVSEVYHDLGFVKVFYEEYTGQDYKSKSVKEHADVYQYVVTGMDAVNAAIEAAREA